MEKNNKYKLIYSNIINYKLFGGSDDELHPSDITACIFITDQNRTKYFYVEVKEVKSGSKNDIKIYTATPNDGKKFTHNYFAIDGELIDCKSIDLTTEQPTGILLPVGAPEYVIETVNKFNEHFKYVYGLLVFEPSEILASKDERSIIMPVFNDVYYNLYGFKLFEEHSPELDDDNLKLDTIEGIAIPTRDCLIHDGDLDKYSEFINRRRHTGVRTKKFGERILDSIHSHYVLRIILKLLGGTETINFIFPRDMLEVHYNLEFLNSHQKPQHFIGLSKIVVSRLTSLTLPLTYDQFMALVYFILKVLIPAYKLPLSLSQQLRSDRKTRILELEFFDIELFSESTDTILKQTLKEQLGFNGLNDFDMSLQFLYVLLRNIGIPIKLSIYLPRFSEEIKLNGEMKSKPIAILTRIINKFNKDKKKTETVAHLSTLVAELNLLFDLLDFLTYVSKSETHLKQFIQLKKRDSPADTRLTFSFHSSYSFRRLQEIKFGPKTGLLNLNQFNELMESLWDQIDSSTDKVFARVFKAFFDRTVTEDNFNINLKDMYLDKLEKTEQEHKAHPKWIKVKLFSTYTTFIDEDGYLVACDPV